MMSLLFFVLMACTFNSLGVVLPMMVKDMGLNWTQAGFGFTLLGLSCGLTSMAPALAIRRIGIVWTLAISAAVLSAGFICLATAHSTRIYDLGTILLGIGFTFAGTVPGTHIISSLYAQPGRALGAYFAIGGLGSVSGPLLFYGSAQIVDGWRPFWFAAAIVAPLIGIAAAGSTRLAKKVSAEEQTRDTGSVPAEGWTVRAALATPQFWIIVASYTGSLMVNTTVHSFAVQTLGEHGISLGRAASAVSLAALVGVGAAAVAGRLGETRGARLPTILSMTCLVIAPMTLILPTNTLSITAFLVSLGVGLGASNVCSATLLLAYFGKAPSLELYSLMCLISTIAAAGPTIGGWMRDRFGAFDPIFMALSGVELLVLVFVLLMRAPHARALGGSVTT